MAHAAQVLHHLLQGTVVGAYSCAAIEFAPTRGFVADEGQQLLFAGQGQSEACGIALHFGGQLEAVGHQHQSRLVAGLAHGNFLEQTHQRGVIRHKRMQIAHHVQIGLRVMLDQLERGLRLETLASTSRLATEAQALQALGHRPGEQAETTFDRQAGECLQHALLIPGLDDHQFDPGIEHQPQIMNIVFHPYSL